MIDDDAEIERLIRDIRVNLSGERSLLSIRSLLERSLVALSGCSPEEARNIGREKFS